MARHQFRQLSNDLYCDVECQCPDPRFADSSVAYLFKRKLKLNGYNDDYFFSTVNAQPREVTCQCGRQLRYQWFPSHVEADWIDSQPPASGGNDGGEG